MHQIRTIINKRPMKFNCFEIGDLIIGRMTYEEAKAKVVEIIGEDWRIPTVGEYFSMLEADKEHHLNNYTGNFNFWLADANDSNIGYVATPLDYNQINIQKSESPLRGAQSVFAVKYDVDLDYLCNDARIDDYCVNKILSMFRKHDTTRLDISFYSDNGVDIPNGIVQESEYDDNTMIGLVQEENPIDKTDFCIYCNNGRVIYLRELSTGNIIDILHMVEDIFKEVDTDNEPLPLMKY